LFAGGNRANNEVTSQERLWSVPSRKRWTSLAVEERATWHRACKSVSGTRTGGTTMQSLAWRWTFAILIGSVWNLIAPLVFAQP
jgi:hypothetical protein